MIILPELEMVVFGPPKCATTTLHHDLVRPPWRGFQLDPKDQHDFKVPEQYSHYTFISPVRDPYERVTSLYWHYLRDVRRERCLAKGETLIKQWHSVPIPSDEISIIDFMEDVMTGTMSKLDWPWYAFFINTISKWLEEAGRLDAFIRVEHLDADWVALVGPGRMHNAFSEQNAPGREPWGKHRSKRAIALIDEWAREDFLRYGYDHQTIAGGGC